MFAALGQNLPVYGNGEPQHRFHAVVLPYVPPVHGQCRVPALQVEVLGRYAEGVTVGKKLAIERQQGVIVGIIKYVVQLLRLSVNSHFLRRVVEVER